jgi:hypothetical protein
MRAVHWPRLHYGVYLVITVNCAAAEVTQPPGMFGYFLGRPAPINLRTSAQCTTPPTISLAESDPVQREIYRLRLSEDYWCRLSHPQKFAGQTVSFASITIERGCVARIDVDFEKKSSDDTTNPIVAMLNSQYGIGTKRTFRTGGMRWDPIGTNYNWIAGSAIINFQDLNRRIIMSTETHCSISPKLQKTILSMEQRYEKSVQLKK